VGLSVPVGRLPAEEAIELADLADEYGSGEVRLTRRQNPIIVDVNSDRVDELLARSRCSRNTGPNRTGSSAGDGLYRHRVLLDSARRDQDPNGDDAPLAPRERRPAGRRRPAQKIHFSGCTADCGQANTADIGLLGMRARKDGEMVEAVDIGVGGGMGEPSFVDYVQQRVPADEAPERSGT